MVCWYSPNSFMKPFIHSCLIWTTHHYTWNVSLMPNNSLDVWKGKFDGIVIRQVRWQEFILHPTSANVNYGGCMHVDCMYLPSCDHIKNVRKFVNMAVVHNDDWVWLRKGLHLIEQAPNEGCKACCVVWTLHNVNVEDAVQWHSW